MCSDWSNFKLAQNSFPMVRYKFYNYKSQGFVVRSGVVRRSQTTYPTPTPHTHTRPHTQAAAQAYIELIVRESDNNVKLIVLDRLTALKGTPAHEKVLQVKKAI